MFDIGIPELLVIGLVAVLVFGPDRLPEFARTAARLLGQVRSIVANAQRDLREELGPDFANLDVRELDPRTFVRKRLLDGMDEQPEVRKKSPADATPYDHEGVSTDEHPPR
ncbi:sec-independent translocase [Kribbella qitaiheensis]|uniref:sec-independent translocase n=1 Tax=Kribbella qitaiheensis TaxID=1544730 RepID=UPI00360A231C